MPISYERELRTVAKRLGLDPVEDRRTLILDHGEEISKEINRRFAWDILGIFATAGGAFLLLLWGEWWMGWL